MTPTLRLSRWGRCPASQRIPRASSPSVVSDAAHCRPDILLELTGSAYLSRLRRADERTRTADLISLRVCGQGLQGLARGCKSGISKPVSLLWLAPCCTVLRSQWCQCGIKRPPVMHRGRYPTSGLSLLSPFPECEETPHLWIATLTGYRVWADMPPKVWTKRRARLKLLLPSASPWGWVGTQPQGDVGGLHRLPHDSYEVAAQGVEIRLVSKLGREGF
jgi:hypothetical protein